MADNNKRNIHYFEARGMKELYEALDGWQNEHHTRFLSLTIEKGPDGYACIALTNPSEVIIVDGSDSGGVHVSSRGCLQVETS